MACNVFNSTANNSEVYKLSSHHWHVMTTARAWQTSSGRRDWWSVEWASSEHKNEHQQWISPQCCLRTDLLIPLCLRAQKLCESGGGRPGLPVPNSLYGLCGRKLKLRWTWTLSVRAQERSEEGGGAGFWQWDGLPFASFFHLSLVALWDYSGLVNTFIHVMHPLQQLVFRALSLWLCSAQLLKEQVEEYTSCFALAGSPPP